MGSYFKFAESGDAHCSNQDPTVLPIFSTPKIVKLSCWNL